MVVAPPRAVSASAEVRWARPSPLASRLTVAMQRFGGTSSELRILGWQRFVLAVLQMTRTLHRLSAVFGRRRLRRDRHTQRALQSSEPTSAAFAESSSPAAPPASDAARTSSCRTHEPVQELMAADRTDCYAEVPQRCLHQDARRTSNEYGDFLECLQCGQRWRHMKECCGMHLPIGCRPRPGGSAPSSTRFRHAHSRECSQVNRCTLAAPSSSVALPVSSAAGTLTNRTHRSVQELMAADNAGRYPEVPEYCSHQAARRTSNEHGNFLECLQCGQRWRHMQDCCGIHLPVGVRNRPGGTAPSSTRFREAHLRECQQTIRNAATSTQTAAPSSSSTSRTLGPSIPANPPGRNASAVPVDDGFLCILSEEED